MKLTFFIARNIKNHWNIKNEGLILKEHLNKGKATLGSLQNFAYVSSYLNLKSFTWKRDCPMSSELQMSWSCPRPFWKVLREFSNSLLAWFVAWFLKKYVALYVFVFLLFLSTVFSTWPKSQDKNLNILRKKRDFKLK